MKKSNKSRSLALALCCALVLTGFTFNASTENAAADETETEAGTSDPTYEYEGTTFTYEVDDGEVTITAAEVTEAQVAVPEEIDGEAVTEIASSVFKDNTTLVSVSLPDSITTLGSSIFYGCSSLESIDLPDGITDIPRSAFAYCTALASVDFPDSLESIQMYAFRGCQSLTELYFPSDLSVIYTYAFAECTGLTYIRLPAVEASIRENNFLESTEVTTIEYPEGCTGLYTGDSGGNGFTVLSYAKTLILPSTLTSITTGSGSYNSDLQSDYFEMFTSLEEIIIAEDNPYYTTYDSCIYDKDLTTLYIVPKAAADAEFAPACETIAVGAFSNCSKITEIVVPETVTTVEGSESSTSNLNCGAFYACGSLQTLTIPETVTSIGTGAIAGCPALTELSLYLDGIYYHFYDADGTGALNRLEIEDGSSAAKKITDDIFALFGTAEQQQATTNSSDTIETMLTSILFPASTYVIPTDFFDGMTSLTSIEVDEENSMYFSENGVLYTGYDTMYNVDTEAVTVDSQQYSDDVCSLTRYPAALGYVDLADKILEIESKAFYQCTAVKELEFTRVIYVGDKAFYGCTGLTLTFADGLSTIGDEAFYGCRDSVITLPDSVVSIGPDAFYTIDSSLTIYCVAGSYVESYAIENGIAYVSTEKEDDDGDTENGNSDGDTENGNGDGDAQKADSSAGTPETGAKYTIGNAVYKVTSSNTVTYVSPAKKSLTKVTIPASVKINGKSYKVTAVSASAFAKMTKLKTVVIGKNVKTIGKKAFYNCKNLKKVTVKSKVLKTVGKKAFKGIAKKAVIKVPKAKKTAYKKLLKKSGISSAIKVK